MNILIADEFQIYRYLFKTYVKRCWPNAVISEVDDVQGASLHLLARHYDLIILDILLPDSYKIEALIELAIGKTPVIVFSENGVNLARMRKFHKLGVDTILRKSDSIEEVLRAFKMVKMSSN